MNETGFAPRAFGLLASLLSDASLHGLAARTLQYQWTRGPRTVSLALAIGNARLRAGEPAEATVFFREVCKREPGHVEGRAGLVCSLFRQNSLREAAREALNLVAIAPCAQMWVLIAELRKRSGDTIGSLDAFRQAAQAESAPNQFVLGEAILGEEAWADLVAPLVHLQKSRTAVGVGTLLVRSRGSSVARAFSSGKTAALVLGLIGISGSVASADDAAPLPSASPSPLPAFHPDVHTALPTAGSLTARVVQLNSGLVLEREEGAGLFPAEPSRFAFRGGSWTQSRIEIDGFDVTDPIFGGRPLVFGAVELGELEVRSDAKGTVLIHSHAPSAAADRVRFIVQANLGVFDSKGTTADPIPSLARGRNLFDGFVAASGSSSTGATNWNGAVSGADVTRSERSSDLERATQRLGFEGRLNHTKGEDDYQTLLMYQGRRAPFGFTTAETRASGLLIGSSWRRRDPHQTQARVSFLRGTTNDPEFDSSLPFERLVDGPPNFQVPYDSSGQRISFEAGRRAPIGRAFGLSVDARFVRSTSARDLSQPRFQALESLNGVSAREWTFSGAEAARMAENRAGLALSFVSEISKRTQLSGRLEVQRATVGDRDGDSILGSTKVLPELRFEWKKSERTELFAEASIGTPPVPLLSYEAAVRNAPAVTARLWRDQNRDGRASASELGLEVARRGPGSVGVDPDLALPNMRRVMIGFRTKVRGLGIRANAYARRDRSLIETALNPLGFEIARTRNLPDPSGDIVGPSDDQILPVVEESLRSFTASQYLLTNPAEHRALGEGAQLAFDTNGKHVHWGLIGAAFRDSGRGGNRGLRVGENDFGVVGESFDRTNTDTFGYGRLFFDRAYSLRMYLTANEVRGFTFGAIGRYDDGQPFARLVIQNDLPQGPDFVQAIPRGRARLHYTLSVDARLAKRVQLRGAQVEMSASVFNALGSQFEAEEQVVWRSDYRRITMVQPPRSLIIGVRIER